MAAKKPTTTRKPRSPRKLAPGNMNDFWYTPLGIQSTSGIKVDETSALTYSAIYRATQILTGTTSTLPIHVYQTGDSDGDRVRLRNHTLHRLLNVRANPEMDSQTFRELMHGWQLNWGNGYAEIQFANDMTPIALWPIHPSRVEVKRSNDGMLAYHVRAIEPGQPTIVMPPRRVLHVKNMSPDGVVGWSVIRLGADSIGSAMAAEMHAGSFFGNGALPSGILKHPGRLKDEAAANRLRAQFTAMHGGPRNKYRVSVLEEGMEYQPMSVDPETSQLLETRRFSLSDIARWYGLPPHFLGDMTQAKFDNVEHMGAEFLTYSLRYWLHKWQVAVATQLLSDEELDNGIYAEFVTEALTAADLMTRYEAYKIGREGGWLSANDILRRENRPGIGPQGDVYLIPMNMTDARQVDANNPDNDDDEQDNDMSIAAERVWTLVAKKEKKALLKAALRPDKFCDWSDTWFGHHLAWTTATLTPLAVAAGADPVQWATDWCGRSRADVDAITAIATSAELANSIARYCDDIDRRANEMKGLIHAST